MQPACSREPLGAFTCCAPHLAVGHAYPCVPLRHERVIATRFLSCRHEEFTVERRGTFAAQLGAREPATDARRPEQEFTMASASIDLLPVRAARARTAQGGARAAAPLAPGSSVLDRYTIVRILDSGAMGLVYAALDTTLGRTVAIKTLRPELAHDTALSERFVNEARLTASLQSPNVVRVYDRGQLPSGEPFMVMEWLRGKSLERVLSERGALPIAEAVDLVMEACVGLAEAHQVGLVHRDVKPANLVLYRGPQGQSLLKVVDFGISKRLHSELGGANVDDSLGSPGYMSPEQATGSEAVDARSDVWSLGVVLFELLTGRLPFDGDSTAESFARVLADPAPSLRALRPDADRELEAVIWRCLEKDPMRRFRNAESLRQALLLNSSEGLRAVRFDGWSQVEDPISPPPKDSSVSSWLGLGLAFGLVAAIGWALTAAGWSTEVAAPSWSEDELGLERVRPPIAAYPARGVYTETPVRGSGGLLLPAEAERERPAEDEPADRPAREYEEIRGVPLDQVWLRERRTYVDGELVDVESQLLEPSPAQHAQPEDKPDGKH